MTIAKNIRVQGRVISCLLVSGLLCVAAVGCKGTVAEPPKAQPPKVTVGNPVQRELVDEEEFSGWVQSSKTVEVRARVQGYIQKIHFEAGDLVESGQLLIELDPRPFQVAIDEAVAQSGAYEAQKVAAEKDVDRYTELVKSGGASKQQLDKAIADAASYDAQIDAMQEQVKQYELDLEFSRITAPISGRISRAMLTEGNLVNAGGSDPLLTTIVALNPMYVYFSVDERTLQRVMHRNAGKTRPRKHPNHCGSRRCRLVSAWIRIRVIHIQECWTLLTTAWTRRPERLRCVDYGRQTGAVRGRFRVKVRVPVSEIYPAVLVPDTADPERSG